MPNTFAYIMLFAWPPLAFVLLRRLPLAAGVSAAMIGAFLLLPSRTAIDLPMLPSFDKTLSGLIAAGLLVAQASQRQTGFSSARPEAGNGILLTGWLPGTRWAQICMLAALVGGAVTVMLNGESLDFGARSLPGLTVRDTFSAIASQVITFLPFLIARRVLATPDAQRMFLFTIIIAAAIYTLPALYEVRMSPQLSRQIYGFFPGSFLQHMRGGGFRPLVFLSHGLYLSLFLAIAYLAALGCVRYLPHRRRPALIVASLLLFATLALSKSLGAFGIALLFTPVVLFAPARLQLLFAAAVALTALSYPVLRGNDLVPVERAVGLAQSIDAERAGSLRFRLENEAVLLAKANEKPSFGWGGWGRSRVYDEKGRDISITDGAWVILFGRGGWVLYLSCFGLLCLPVLLTAARYRTLPPDGMTITLALLLAANLIDLVPNSGLLPITWMMAGALTGRLEWQRAGGAAQSETPGATPSGLFAPSPVSTPQLPTASPSPFTPVLRDGRGGLQPQAKPGGLHRPGSKTPG